MIRPRVSMELDDHVMASMTVGASFRDFTCKINSLDFHETDEVLVTASDDESIRLYDTGNAGFLKMIYSKKYGVDQICFTHRKGCVLYASKNGWDESLRYLSLFDNKYICYFKGHRDRVVSLCMCPRSETAFSGSLDHTVRVWDLRSNVCQGMLRVQGRPSVACDKQGLIFAVTSNWGTVKLFDLRQFEKGPFETFEIDVNYQEIRGMKFSNDGKLLLLSTSSQIFVLDAFEGVKLHEYFVEPDPDGAAIEACFSPDGQYILSGSGDATLHAWNTFTGQEVATWMSQDGVPAVVKWAPQRLMFATASTSLSFHIPDFRLLGPSFAPSSYMHDDHPPG
ncbi:hypothetical protein GOP47_0022854 [Adiantum capillus-veneris]|uniref:Uncharacterized protein n=1 Tax=Adiantum capillus-veneris TaxID=13818 RepID=A0A9D4U6M1_ADICA|nr:hypothetical protein GOP47_0022854 [Adiantum capillus-veneris]